MCVFFVCRSAKPDGRNRIEREGEAERTRMIHEKEWYGFLPVAGSNIHTKNKRERKKVIHSVFGVGKTQNRKEK